MQSVEYNQETTVSGESVLLLSVAFCTLQLSAENDCM